MKLNSKIALILGLTSSVVFASEYKSPLDNVKVYDTELQTLSIQNLSDEKVEIEIYGKYLVLQPASGIKFDCESYDNLELQIKNNFNDYFDVPCKSRVVFSEFFANEIKQGE